MNKSSLPGGAGAIIKISVIVFLAFLVPGLLHWLDPFERRIGDLFFSARWRSNTGKILIINLGKENPVPRERLAKVLESIPVGSFRALGIDIMLRDDSPGDSECIRFLKNSDNAVISCPLKEGPAAGGIKAGFSELPLDSDGICRRADLFIPGMRLPSFAMWISCVYNGCSIEDIHPGARRLAVGNRMIIPLERDGTMRVSFRDRWLFLERRYDQLQTIKWEQFRQGIVLLGSTEQEESRIPTPIDGSLPGVHLQAQIVNTIIQKDFVTSAPVIDAIILFCLCIFSAWLAGFCKTPWKAFIALAILLSIYFTSAFYTFTRYGVALNMATPMAAAATAFIVTGASRLIYRQKRDSRASEPGTSGEESSDKGGTSSDVKSVTDVKENMILGKYRIIRKLGEGGMGEVFLAEHLNLNVSRVLKLIRPELLVNPVIRERFHTEAELSARLTDPQIIDIHDYGEFNGIPYIEMEYFESYSLKKEIDRMGPLSALRILVLLEKMTAGLRCAHNARPEPMIHRDLKPENILISVKDPGTIKIIDFGLAKALKGDPGTTLDGSAVFGTPYYMAPEIIKQGPVGPGTDIYALGIMVFEMATKALPFSEGGYFGILKDHLEHSIPSLHALNDAFPEEIDSVIAKAMAKDIGDRYGDVDSFFREFQNAMTWKAE